MKHESNEPTAAPKPCSLPHSAPVAWLNGGASQPGGLAAHDIEPAADPPEPEPPVPAVMTPHVRHDGWTGEKMAVFCEALAESAVVAEACEAARMGISGAYACRRRNPVFAAAWDAALTIARERLADTLLARSMEGNIEQIWRDGELVGERHVIDNRLGLAILRRLDRLAETGMTVSTRGERFTFSGGGRSPGQRDTAASQRLGPGLRRETFDWELAVTALRTGDEAAVCKALALFERPALSLSKGHEVEEVYGPPDSLSQEEDGIDYSDRCWLNEDCDGRVWMTDFPPPPGFDGYQKAEFGAFDYERECSAEEVAILEADAQRARDAERAEEEALRDEWFALLRSELPSTAKAERSGRCRVESQRARATGRASEPNRRSAKQRL